MTAHVEADGLLPLTHILEDIEIRGVTVHFPSGPVPGFQWRYRLTLTRPGSAGRTDEWSPWVFASRPSVEAMLDRWRSYLQDGTFGPGTRVQ